MSLTLLLLLCVSFSTNKIVVSWRYNNTGDRDHSIACNATLQLGCEVYLDNYTLDKSPLNNAYCMEKCIDDTYVKEHPWPPNTCYNVSDPHAGTYNHTLVPCVCGECLQPCACSINGHCDYLTVEGRRGKCVCDSGFDVDFNCTRCVKSGFDPTRNCLMCISGLDNGSNCTTCSNPKFDIAKECKTCLEPGFDSAMDCKTCLPGLDLSTNCKTCEKNHFIIEGNVIKTLKRNITAVNQGLTTNCERYDLTGESLNLIEEDLFENYIKLDFVNLTNNAITRLPYNVFHTLENRNKATIVLDIQTKCSIYGFNITNGHLTRKTGPKFDYLSQCTSLDISDYGLTSLDDSVFEGMGKLEFLDMTLNSISAVPVGVFDELSHLVLDGTLLLDLDTKCSSYAFGVSADGVLTKKTSPEFGYVDACAKINLPNMAISKIDPSCFNNNSELRVLNLENNELNDYLLSYKFGTSLYQKGALLEILNLNKNNIKKIEKDVFPEEFKTNLKELHLSDNAIEELKSNTFNHITSPYLTLIDLSNNNIQLIQSNSLSNTINANTTLNLTNNIIDCCSSLTELILLKDVIVSIHCQNLNQTITRDNNSDPKQFCTHSQQIHYGNQTSSSLIAIIAGCVGGVAVLIIIVVVAILVFRKRKSEDLLQGKSAQAFVLDSDNDFSQIDENSQCDYSEVKMKRISSSATVMSGRYQSGLPDPDNSSINHDENPSYHNVIVQLMPAVDDCDDAGYYTLGKQCTNVNDDSETPSYHNVIVKTVNREEDHNDDHVEVSETENEHYYDVKSN